MGSGARMRILLDTHVLVWLLDDSERISDEVHAQIQQAADEDLLFVSAITPWEIAMLVSKGRLRLGRMWPIGWTPRSACREFTLSRFRLRSPWPARGCHGRFTPIRRTAFCWPPCVIWMRH